MILAKVIVLAIVMATHLGLAEDYDNFGLPGSSSIRIPPGKISYQGKRIRLKGGKVKFRKPSIRAEEFLFAKQAFLTEKREQAIKLLRQELDSGYKRNRDNMLLRLGQLQTEKYKELSYLETQMYNERLKEYEQSKKKKKKVPKLDHSRSYRYLRKALTTFTQLEKQYPKHPKIDEIVFFLGFVNMEFGRVKKGSAYLNRLVKRYRKSKKYEEALLYLGDYHFDKRQYRQALKKYRVILRRKNSPLYNYALYKTAWSELNVGKKRQGLNSMKKLVKLLKSDGGEANFSLREQALRDLVVFFAELEQVDEAIAYFEDELGRDSALLNLKSIAASLLAKNKDAPATKAYGLLIKEFGDSIDAPKYYLALYDTRTRQGKYKSAVELLLETNEKFNPESSWYRKQKKSDRARANEQIRQVSKEVKNAAFFYHRTAQKTRNKSYYNYALQLYQSLEKYSPQDPEARKIVFYQAEILYSQNKWLESANRYMQIAKQKPKDKLAEESLYNALLALDNLTAKSSKLKRFDQNEIKNRKFEKQDLSEGEKKFIEVAETYLKEYPKSKRAVDVRFRIASIYYRNFHFDEAASAFQDLALKHPKHKSATTAAHIVLDIYNIKKDFVSLNSMAAKFAATKGLGSRQFKQEMSMLRSEVAFKNIEKLEADKKWEKAGEAYLSFYKKNPRGKLAEKSLYNAVISFERGKDAEKTASTSRLFIKKYPKHFYVKRLMLRQAQSAENAYDYEQARSLYYQFQKKYPKDSQSKSALYNAAVFAELTDRNQLANKLYKDYLRLHRPNKEERKSIMRAQAKLYAKRRYWTKVGEAYAILVREASSRAEKLQILGEQADLYRRKGRRSDEKTVKNRIRYIAGNAKPQPSWGSAVDYIVEHKFSRTANQRRRYERIRLEFPPARLVSRIKRKQKALVSLASTYDGILDMGSPKWAVAALYSKSQAYQHFVKSYRKLRIPRQFKGEQRKQIEKELEVLDTQSIKPLEAKAKEILKACAEKASEFYLVGTYVSKCQQGLRKDIADVRPTGLIPKPAYWTTRWLR